MATHYPGVNLTAVGDPSTRDVLAQMDRWMRDASRQLATQSTAGASSSSGIVTSVSANGGTDVQGDIDLVDGNGIDITQSAQDITIAANLAELGTTFLRLDTANDPLTAALDMDGNTLTDWGGATSSNAALLSLVANPATGAGVVGIEHRWSPATTETVDTYINKWSYNDGSNTFDMARLGFGRAVTTGILWLVDKDEDTNSAITDWTIIAGDSNNEFSAGTVAMLMNPNALSGAITFRAGGTTALLIRKSGLKVDLGAGWSLSNTDVFTFRSATQDDDNGTFQLGTENTTQSTSGWFATFNDKIAPGSGLTAAYRIAGVRWDGGLFSGRSGNNAVLPADGFVGAHGWVKISDADDQAGVDFIIEGGGPGTGDSTGGGDTIFMTPDAGATGTAIQAKTEKARLHREGDLSVKGFNHATVAKTADYTFTDTDGTVESSASSVNLTHTLPDHTATRSGRIYNMTKRDATAFTSILAAAGSDTINGGATLPALSTQYDSWTVQRGATEWMVI